MEKVFLRLVGGVIELPDKIIGMFDATHIKKGWVVKKRGATDLEGEKGMVLACNLALQSTKTVAGYKDGDLELWDVIMVFKSEAEARTAAKLNGQMTIYQIETGKLVWID